MRYCPDCRLQLPDEARHCPSCGRPLPTDGADAAYRNPYAAAPAEDAGSRYEGASLFSGDAPVPTQNPFAAAPAPKQKKGKAKEKNRQAEDAPADATKRIPSLKDIPPAEATKAIPDVRDVKAAPFRLPADKVLRPKSEMGKNAPAPAQEEAPAQEKKPKKKKKRVVKQKKGVMVPLVTLILIVGVIGALVLFFHNQLNPPAEKKPPEEAVPAAVPIVTEIKNHVVYLSGGDLYYFDTDQHTAVLLAREITDDGTFRYDEGDVTFPEGDGAITAIGRSVQLGADGKTLLYPVSADPAGHYLLYCQDLSGGEPIRVAENVKSYTMSRDGKRVTYLDGVDALWQVSLPGCERTKISDSVPDGYAVSDDGTHAVFRTADNQLISFTPGKPNAIAAKNVAKAYYLRDDLVYYLNHSHDLYLYNGKEAAKVSSGVTEICAVYPDGQVYFLKDTDNKLILSDFIEDDLALADAAIGKPEPPVAPVYKDFPNLTAYNKAFDEYEKQYAQYEAQKQVYQEKLARDQLRRGLGETKWVHTLQTLCYYDGEVLTVISERVDLDAPRAFSEKEPAVAFLEILPSSVDKIRFSEMESADKAEALAEQIISQFERSYLALGKETMELGGQQEAVDRIDYAGGTIYYRGVSGAFWSLDVKNGAPGTPTRRLWNVRDFAADPANKRFVAFSGENDGVVWQQMSLLGRLTEDRVAPETVRFLEDGTILYLADCGQDDAGFYSGTLRQCKNDVVETLADHVRMYDVTAEGHVVCLRALTEGRGELYLCGEGALKNVSAAMLLGDGCLPRFSQWLPAKTETED